MQPNLYNVLGTDWMDDAAYKCCVDDPNDTPSGCDCCYDTWVKELKEVNLEYNQVNEQAKQISEKYKFITEERDKLKIWVGDLEKAHDLAKAVCAEFQVMHAQSEKICINSEKTVQAIEILFCMIRDLFEQLDYVLTIYNQVEACIKCYNSEDFPENSGIRKCLKEYLEKLEAVLKTRTEIIKAIMKVVRDANVLHEFICSDFGLVAVIGEWTKIMNCDEKCGGGEPAEDTCEPEETEGEADDKKPKCRLRPVLTLPICNDGYYLWVKERYEDDIAAASEEYEKLLEINKKKESLSACQKSLQAAIKEVDPKELCK